MNSPLSYSFGMSIVNSHLLARATMLLINDSMMEKPFCKFFKEQI